MKMCIDFNQINRYWESSNLKMCLLLLPLALILDGNSEKGARVLGNIAICFCLDQSNHKSEILYRDKQGHTV